MKMTSRERIRAAINHKEADRIPIDFGGMIASGINANALPALRSKLGLKEQTPKVVDPLLFLAEIDDDLRRAIGGDVIGVNSPYTILGNKNENWKHWRTPNNLDVLMAGDFAYTRNDDNSVFAYPKGNLKARPSAKMPSNGFYFDNIVRQENLDHHVFDARVDYQDQYKVMDDELCRYYEDRVNDLYTNTEYSIFGDTFFGTIGDIFHIPAAWLENPKGIRDLEEWIIAPYTHPEYVHDYFAMHTEIALQNLELFYQAVGNKIDVIAISGTDFGAQNGLFLSKDCYREFFKPCHEKINNWVHANTNWKVCFHSCGSVYGLIDDFIDAGVDILNPIQTSAADMEPGRLKEKYGDKIVFWGGGANPQNTMIFGSPEEVKAECKRNIEILSKGGGLVFAHVHNIQSTTPADNIIALFDAAKEYQIK